MLLALLPLLLAAQTITPPTTERSGVFNPAIAILRSGTRVEADDPKVGDTTMLTPLGLFSIPLDPVVQVVDGRVQQEGFRRLRALGLIEDLDLLADLSTAGQLTDLLALVRELQARDPELLPPFSTLEAWAKHLDPVPPLVKHEARVAWLWEIAQEEDFVAAVIAGQRLVEEVVNSKTASADRQLTLREIRNGLEHEAAWTRRSAARVAGAQFSNDIPLLLELGRQSIADPAAPARDGAAWAASHVFPQFAFAVWVAVFCRGNELSLRVAAAEGLGRHCDEIGLRALCLVLSTTQHRAPNRYDYAGRKIWVVTGALGNVAELQYLKKWGFLMPSPDGQPLEDGSVLRVTTVALDLEKNILRVLEESVGSAGPTVADGPRTATAWLNWYAERVDPERP